MASVSVYCGILYEYDKGTQVSEVGREMLLLCRAMPVAITLHHHQVTHPCDDMRMP